MTSPFSINSVYSPFPPSKDVAKRAPQPISGTGATAAVSNKMDKNRAYTLAVGAVPVKVAFYYSGSVSTGSAVATTDMALAAYQHFTFTAYADDNLQEGAQYLYVVAADGTSAFTATLWQSGT